jgi:hypothetical protein
MASSRAEVQIIWLIYPTDAGREHYHVYFAALSVLSNQAALE